MSTTDDGREPPLVQCPKCGHSADHSCCIKMKQPEMAFEPVVRFVITFYGKFLAENLTLRAARKFVETRKLTRGEIVGAVLVPWKDAKKAGLVK